MITENSCISSPQTDQFSGDRPVTDFLEDLKGLFLRTDLSALSQTHVPPSYSGATYEATVSVHRKLQEFLALVAPGVYVDSGTTARLSRPMSLPAAWPCGNSSSRT